MTSIDIEVRIVEVATRLCIEKVTLNLGGPEGVLELYDSSLKIGWEVV
jgi:hypothetical protein